MDADHCDCNNLFHTQFGVESKHTVLEVKLTILRSVSDLKNDCARGKCVVPERVYCSHLPSSLVAETVGITDTDCASSSHCPKNREQRTCHCVLHKTIALG